MQVVIYFVYQTCDCCIHPILFRIIYLFAGVKKVSVDEKSDFKRLKKMSERKCFESFSNVFS